jgi:hypothetical protein
MEADFKESFSRMIRSKSPPSMGSPSIKIIFDFFSKTDLRSVYIVEVWSVIQDGSSCERPTCYSHEPANQSLPETMPGAVCMQTKRNKNSR